MNQTSATAEQLQRLLEVSRVFAVTCDLDVLLGQITQACCTVLGCERASIFLHDSKKQELWSRVAMGTGEIRVLDDRGIVGETFKSNLLIHVSRPYEDPRFNPEPDRAGGFVTRNLLSAPMVDLNRQPLGVLQAINTTDDDFSPSDRMLIQLLADEAGVAIQRSQLQQQALAGAELRRELEVAHDVQKAMIPTVFPTIPGIACAGYTQPASITGGDCFDLWTMRDGSLGIFLGDGTGHGIAPALMIAQVRTVIRALCDYRPEPAKLFETVNKRFADDFAPGTFVTAFYATLSHDGLLRWCSAGHGPLLFQPDPKQPPQLVDANSPPLGIVREDFHVSPADPVQLQPGGMVTVVSDGIFEARDPNRRQFGMARVAEVLQKTAAMEPARRLQQLHQSVLRWQQAPLPQDDQTAVMVVRA